MDDIEAITNGDLKKQYELAKSILRLVGGNKELGGNSDAGWKIVQSSLQEFFSTLEEKYKRRFPNDVRAAHQAVCAAITAAAPAKSLLVVACATGASVAALRRGRQRWTGWMVWWKQHRHWRTESW